MIEVSMKKCPYKSSVNTVDAITWEMLLINVLSGVSITQLIYLFLECKLFEDKFLGKVLLIYEDEKSLFGSLLTKMTVM